MPFHPPSAGLNAWPLEPSRSDPGRQAGAVLEVAAGVILDGNGRVLIAIRPDHLHQGGLAEFPGGKLEPGETPEQALYRELREELAIDVEQASPLIAIRHDYPDRAVRLWVFRVERFRGEPRGVQGQPIAWVAADQLPALEFPAANRPIVAAARLPDLYAILDAASGDPAVVCATLGRFRESGIRLVRLRGNALPADRYAALAAAAAHEARRLGLDLLLSGSPNLVQQTGAAGLHLRSAELLAARERPVGRDVWLAASCHSLRELQQAADVGADFAVLGPVAPTASHPGARILGWDGFAELAAAAFLPVFALGGMTRADTAEAKRCGGQGVAGIRGFLERGAP